MKQTIDQTLFPDSAERDNPIRKLDNEPNVVRLMRIAEGVELLERMALGEKDPVRQAALCVALAEAKCIG
ncbi:MAG TPA: hypothetical protein VJA21_13610 [Verrucomicrobiae bacterium]